MRELRRLLAAERQRAQQLLGEVAADAVAKIVTLARMSTPGSTAPRGVAVPADAAVAGADADDARAVEQHRLRRRTP